MKFNWSYFMQCFSGICLGFILVGLLTACNSSNSSSSSAYSFSKINCYVRYIAQTRELQADMTFRTDSTKAIEGPVTINEMPMVFKKRPVVGLQYRLTKHSTTFDQNYTFSYTQKDGQKENLAIQLNDFKNLHIASDGMSKANGGLLKWDGEPLGPEDGFVLIFTDSKGNTFSINHTGISKGTQFEIIKGHADRLAIGPATLQITRKKTTIEEENGTIRMLTIEYYPKPLLFEVKQ